ncbi:MAG: GGDEF domain-containing protein [Rhodoferax sp.]|nr:GGDEF domain-containing protein [Rhodoferax sp.]
MMRATALGLSLRNAPASSEADAISQPAALDHVPSGVSSNASALLQILAPSYGTDVASCDWDALFDAVKERLRSVIDAPTDTAGRRADDPQLAKRVIGECLLALDQLHHSMANELGRLQPLELEVFDAKTELAQARAELVGTQAGERRARHLALHDSLTSLPNRGYFVERLDHALALAAPQRRPLSVMYLDLDDFKPINDAHGHAAGDELLRIVAARLSHVVRGEDMVSRLGGDEFAFLLTGLDDRAQLAQLARKVFDAVSAPCKVGKLRLVVRPSIGIAMCPGDGETSDALLQNADAAMYYAKRRNLNHAFCGES